MLQKSGLRNIPLFLWHVTVETDLTIGSQDSGRSLVPACCIRMSLLLLMLTMVCGGRVWEHYLSLFLLPPTASSLFPWEWFFSLPFALSGEAPFFIFLVFRSFSYTLGFRDTFVKSGLNIYNRAEAGAIPASVWKFSVVFFWVFLHSP